MINNREDFIKIMKGSAVNRSLNSLQARLKLVYTASLLAHEGINRISASELLEKVSGEINTSMTASEVGQILVELGMKKATIHGKSRFILDEEQLKEIWNSISSQCEERTKNLQLIIKEFKELTSGIEALQKEWQNILKLDSRKRELIKAINENRDKVSNVGYLENQWNNLQEKAKRAIELENEIKALTARIKELPSLEQKKAALEEVIQKYNAESYQLSQREASLGRALQQFKERNAWADLHTLNYNIQLKREELGQLSRQLGEKRSLLDKLLMRRKEGGER